MGEDGKKTQEHLRAGKCTWTSPGLRAGGLPSLPHRKTQYFAILVSPLFCLLCVLRTAPGLPSLLGTHTALLPTTTQIHGQVPRSPGEGSYSPKNFDASSIFFGSSQLGKYALPGSSCVSSSFRAWEVMGFSCVCVWGWGAGALPPPVAIRLPPSISLPEGHRVCTVTPVLWEVGREWISPRKFRSASPFS